MVFRVAFVAGVTPDKWLDTFRRRFPGILLDAHPVETVRQRAVLLDDDADVCFVRLPVDREGLHCIPLYRELPVVVVPLEHVVSAYDEIALADLAGEQLVYGDVPDWPEVAAVEQLPFPDMTAREAVDVVASGTGIAIMPMSVARLHHRNDVTHRIVTGVPDTQVGLAWRIDADDPRIETFIGIVRGRTENTSRGSADPAAAPPAGSIPGSKPGSKAGSKAGPKGGSKPGPSPAPGGRTSARAKPKPRGRPTRKRR